MRPEVWGAITEVMSLQEVKDQDSLCLSCKDNEKVAVYEPGSELSLGTESASTSSRASSL